MRAAALCPHDTQSPLWRACEELARAIGIVKTERAGPGIEGRSPVTQSRGAFSCITSLDELAPLPDTDAAELARLGGCPVQFDVLILPNLAEFKSPRDFARRLRQLSAWGVTVYLCPSSDPLNRHGGLIEALAQLDSFSAERLEVARAEAKLAEQHAERKYEALFAEKVRVLDASVGIASLMAPTVAHLLNGGSPAVGARFRQWRESEGITLREVGARLQRLGVEAGVSETAISRFETASRTSRSRPTCRRPAGTS